MKKLLRKVLLRHSVSDSYDLHPITDETEDKIRRPVDGVDCGLNCDEIDGGRSLTIRRRVRRQESRARRRTIRSKSDSLLAPRPPCDSKYLK